MSVNNLAAFSLASDGVFRDGVGLQTAAMTGTVAAGYEVSPDVTITP